MGFRTARVAVLAGSILLVATPATARHSEWKSWSLHFGGGFTPPVANTADHVDTGWGLQLGMTRWFGQRPLGIQFEVAFNSLGLADRSLGALGVPGGDVDVWPFTLSGVYSPMQKGSIGFYVLGGLGPYLLHARATATAPGGAGCDPWWWDWCFPGGSSGITTLGSVTKLRLGLNGGVGLSFDAGRGTSVYVEGRFHQVFVPGDDAQVVPLVFGVRW